MDAESILKPIDRFLESIEGSYFEARALQMKEEVEEAINDILLQMKADGAYEECLADCED